MLHICGNALLLPPQTTRVGDQRIFVNSGDKLESNKSARQSPLCGMGHREHWNWHWKRARSPPSMVAHNQPVSEPYSTLRRIDILGPASMRLCVWGVLWDWVLGGRVNNCEFSRLTKPYRNFTSTAASGPVCSASSVKWHCAPVFVYLLIHRMSMFFCRLFGMYLVFCLRLMAAKT